MNDHPDVEDTSTEALIDRLRAEIVELEGAEDDGDVELPTDLSELLTQLSVSPRVASAVDDLLASDDPITEDLATRIREGVESVRAEQGMNLRFLEQVVAHVRTARGISAAEVAERISASDTEIADVERGDAAFDALEERQVADWIDFLEVELETAVEALRRSLAAPATSYGGATRDKGQVEGFVRGVEAILRERHGGERQPDA